MVDECSKLVLQKFRDLGIRVAPGTWTVLAAVVARIADGSARVVSLATGVKCLPAATLRPGNLCADLVRDCHAEALARRGLIAFLQTQWAALLTDGGSSDILERAKCSMCTASEPHCHCKTGSTDENHDKVANALEPCCKMAVRVRPDVLFSLWVSHAPCGGASMASVASSAIGPDGAPRHTDAPARHGIHRGREHSHASALSPCGQAVLVPRTKPGRRDAPPVASLSCADKIARWTAAGWQGSHVPFAVHVDSAIVGDGFALDELALISNTAHTINNGAKLDFTQATERFEHGRREGLSPASNAHVWWEGLQRRGSPFETLVDGRLHGSRKPGADGKISPVFVSSVATSNMRRRSAEVVCGETERAAMAEQLHKAKVDLLCSRASPYSGWPNFKRETMEGESAPPSKRSRISNSVPDSDTTVEKADAV